MQTSKRNRNAGKHPSYDKAGMSAEAIKKKRAYDKAYSAKPEMKKYRSELNKANRKAQKTGKAKVGDGKDASHTKSGNIVMASQKVNRSYNGRGNRPRHHK